MYVRRQVRVQAKRASIMAADSLLAQKEVVGGEVGDVGTGKPALLYFTFVF